MSYSVVLVLLIVQGWIFHELWRAASRRYSGRSRKYAHAGVSLFSAAVAVCFLLSYAELIARLGLGGPVPTVLGAVGILYLFVAAPFVLVLVVSRALRKQFEADVDPARRRVLNAAASALIASPFMAIGYGGLVQRTNFRIRELDLPIGGLPPDLVGVRILHISDIHLSPFLSESEFARVIDAGIELRPHLAVVTGDLISIAGDPLDACIRQIARLRADAGIFGCMGNHERYAGVEDYTAEACRTFGIQFLRAERRSLRFGKSVLNVAGVDYQPASGTRHYLEGAGQLIAPGACNLLLSHNPDVFPVAERQGWNAMLSGHTHGGQVTVEILDRSLNPARFMTPYVYGLYRINKAAAYVTRGVGSVGVPVRIGAPPEIAVLRLRSA